MDQIISQRSPKLCLSSLRVGFTNEDIGYDIFATYTFSQKKTVNTSAMSEKNADHSPGKHCLLNPFILPTVLGLFWFSGTEGEMQRSTRHVFGPRCVPGPGGTSAQPHLGQPSPLLGELHLLYGRWDFSLWPHGTSVGWPSPLCSGSHSSMPLLIFSRVYLCLRATVTKKPNPGGGEGWWLKQQNFFFPWFWRLEVHDQRVRRAVLSLKAGGENPCYALFLPPAVAGTLWHFFGSLTPCSSLCVVSCGVLSWVSSPLLVPSSLDYISRGPCPKKITFIVILNWVTPKVTSGIRTSTNLFEGCNSTRHTRIWSNYASSQQRE